MKRLLSLLVVVGFVLAIPASQLMWGKGHVPLGMRQVCHEGVVTNIAHRAFGSHRSHGDCLLPACDFNNIFIAGDACSTTSKAARCTLDNPREPANKLTAACPPGAY